MHPKAIDQENKYYDQFLSSWNEIPENKRDGIVWISRSILSVLKEDVKNSENEDLSWNKILTNCFVLILALAGPKEVDIRGGTPFNELSEEQRHQYLMDLALHFGESGYSI